MAVKLKSTNTVIFLMGATAAGKTRCAVELHENFPVSIISVDSALIYRDMDIGTAKPDSTILAKAPHRLISFLDPAQSWSVAGFYKQALSEIKSIHGQGKIPLLVGGTMMYFRALQQGLAFLPESDPQTRAAIEAQAAAEGWPSLHAHLHQIDPESAARIHPNDPQRIQRAIEVYRLSGRPLSQWLEEAAVNPLPYDIIKLVAGPENRRALDDVIEHRFNLMLDQGFLDEVRALQQRGDLNLKMPSMRCVGYRQAWDHLLGNLSVEEMKQQSLKATRMLAKRQYTWLRSESDCHWFDTVKDQQVQQCMADLLQKNIEFNSHT